MSSVGSVYLFTLVSALCLLFGLNFLFRKGNLVVARILAVEFLLLGYLVVAAFFLLPENIIETPYFFRTMAPLFYLLPPLNFLFLWYLFHPSAKFKRLHLLFFLPFVFQFIEYLPYYLSDKATKVQEINWMLEKGDFFAFSERFMWFDPMYHVYAKFVMYLIFFGAMVYYFLQFRREKKYAILFQKGFFNYWIIGVLVFRFCTLFYIWYTFIYTDNGKTSYINTDYLLVAEFIYHILFFLINPHFLDVLVLSENLNDQSPKKEEFFSGLEQNNQLSELAEKIEEYFRTTKVFLNSQLTAELLSSLIGYPHRMIGQAIRHTHGISFRDYLNNYRITHLEEKLSDPEFLAKSSIETIAEAAGFGTRQSFYTAFKKAKGCTPKEYFNMKLR
jgi:AraC-like DNA-binding protein